jgi:outer membrane murein-binding lipoprotein Lpp
MASHLASKKTEPKQSSQPTQPVNFYFGNLENSGLVSGSDTTDKASTSYIILQNDFLHSKVKELEDQVHELTAQVAELEDDNESLETSKTSLKGYVHNQGEFNKLSKKLVDIYDYSINSIAKSKDELEWNVKFLGLAFIAFECALMIYKLYNFDIFGIIELAVLNGIGCYIAMKVYKPYLDIIKIKDIKNRPMVIKIESDMKEASKGNDYLNDLIDRL